MIFAVLFIFWKLTSWISTSNEEVSKSSSYNSTEFGDPTIKTVEEIFATKVRKLLEVKSLFYRR
jgi:hypothetical protein